MALRISILALSMITAASSLAAAGPQPDSVGAPTASPDARYCMRVGPITGSLVERVRCWTREQWAEQGVDVDKEWAEEGVTVIEPGVRA